MMKLFDDPLLFGSLSTCKLLRATSASCWELYGISNFLKIYYIKDNNNVIYLITGLMLEIKCIASANNYWIYMRD